MVLRCKYRDENLPLFRGFPLFCLFTKIKSIGFDPERSEIMFFVWGRGGFLFSSADFLFFIKSLFSSL